MENNETPEGFELNYKAVYHIERQKRVWDAWIYGHQRIDILMITICGAGIYVCLETAKYSMDHGFSINWTLKVSAISLLVSIILNLISQWFSTKIQYNDFEICEYCISQDEEKLELCMDEIKKREAKINAIEPKMILVEKCGFASLIIGLLLLIVFFIFIF